MHAFETVSLFERTGISDRLAIADADILFIHRFFSPEKAGSYLSRLLRETPWEQPTVRVWGKDHLQPRLSCWVGEADAVYRFSGKTFVPHPWTETLREIRQAIETATQCRFNSALLNLYRDGGDSIAMHSDNEAELGRMPVIASLSLGATRVFRMKHRQASVAPVSIALSDGSLLIMAGSTQQNWLHGVPKQSKAGGPRINLTFRHILPV